jgi:ABC-type antimicrobial peptide transport system permease subunit
VVDLRPGSNQRATLVALEETGLSGPLRAGDIDVTELVDLDVQQADNVPRLFGGLMAVLGLGVLMHLVLTGLQAGRRELATLRALGFTTRQVRSSAAWQASVATVVPFVVGAIVGAVVGRRVWLAYADRLNVAPATVSGWRPIVGFFLAFLVLANVIGALAAWRAVRRRSSVELRSE